MTDLERMDRRLQCGPQTQMWKSKARNGWWEFQLGNYHGWLPSWHEAMAAALAMHKRSKRPWLDAQ